jgi:hypothetical protein
MKPRLKVLETYNPILTPDTKLVMDAMQDRCIRKVRADAARKALAWSTNLVDARQYRACPCGCGLTYMSRHNPGRHIDPSELIADWQTDEPQRVEDFMNAPVEIPLKPAVSQAQVLRARDMVAQYPRKSKAQICDENGGITWAQLESYAKTPLAGLPERKGQKASAPHAQAKPAEKPVKPKSTKKAKRA